MRTKNKTIATPISDYLPYLLAHTLFKTNIGATKDIRKNLRSSGKSQNSTLFFIATNDWKTKVTNILMLLHLVVISKKDI